MVVRSDLLADQNVPVFCQVDALQINPLIDIKQIKNIRFSGGTASPYVAGTGFHPARAALNTRDVLLGSPLVNNIGYVVVILKRNQVESTLPKFVNVTLSAQLEYDAGNAIGVGRSEFLLSIPNAKTAEISKIKNSFWNGRYSLKLEEIDPNFATVSVYDGDARISTQKVERGKISGEIYMPGSYCTVALQISYDGMESAAERARIEVTNELGTDSFDVYKGSSFLNGRCSVSGIEIDKLTQTGNITATCDGKSFLLEKKSIIKENLEVITKDNREGVVKSILGENATVAITGGKEEQIALKDLKPKVLVDVPLGTDADKAFKEVIEGYEKVATDFPGEKSNPEGISTIKQYGTYGETALSNAINLAERYGQYATKERLLTKIIELYPNSENSENYRSELSSLYSIDSESSSTIVTANGRVNVIRLKELNSPSKVASASFVVDNNPAPISIEEGKTNEFLRSVQIRVNKVYAGEANADILCWDNAKRAFQKEGTYTLKLNEGKEVCSGRIIKLSEVQLDQVARIKVLPKSKGTETETNLTVMIGIEKRAIKLSPAKTKEMIKTFNESIAKWEKISEKLDKVVTGLKATCFATSAVLTVKSFMSGVSGQTLARQQAMSGPDGWKIKCQGAINKGWIDRNGNGQRDNGEDVSYRTPMECFNKEAANINGDITAITNALQNVNKGIAEVEKKPGVTSGSLISGKNVNEQEARKQYLAYLKSIYPDDSYIKSLNINNDGTASFSYDDLRQLAYDKEISAGNRAGLISIASKTDKALKENINARANMLTNTKNQAAIIGVTPTPVGLVVTQPKSASGQVLDLKTEPDKITLGGKTLVLPASITTLGGADSAMYITGAYEKVDDKNMKTGTFQENNLLVVGKKEGNKLTPLGVYGYAVSGTVVTLTTVSDPKININNFQSTYSISEFVDSGGGLEMGSIGADDRKVRYFETGPDKGLASYIPLLPDEGFYVRIDSSLKVGNNIAAYDSSGLPKAWNICNTGKNGIVELSADKCYFYTTGAPVESILQQSKAKSTTLLDYSRKAIMQANTQANNPFVVITLDKKYQYSKGAPISTFAGTECQEFMSISDCKWLFNVCDPVICPPTRCNLGGKYPVADVIQTGIVGSVLLCLPNYREGIVMPVCLSGIKSGVDGWISVLKAHRDCLQENLNSGRMIGICEQMYSIYACDFWWRQVGPVANILIPKMIESIYTGGQGARGGGEYRTIQTAWDNTEKSIDYFTQSYAVNAFKAFQTKSIQEIGSEVCKGYISAKGPTALKSLVESESPPQFHAWFTAIAYTSATVPATSQYSVYYHIYAGKNAGVYYSVYLKNPPDSPYYSQTSTLPVASGFVGQDQSADDTKVFTAPEGYQELCVRVNNEEKCGFKQVSTSYAVNTLRDTYVKEQITQADIKSQNECISGSASLGSLLANTNPQAALEEAALPGISNRGIVRICSATNPGGSINPSNWQEVGYCDSQNMICWLDQNSVDNAITVNNLGLKNATYSELNQNLQNAEPGKYYVDATGVKEIKEISALVGRIKDGDVASADTVITRIDAIQPNFVMNNQKAALVLIKAMALEKKYKLVLDSAKGPITKPSTQPTTTEALIMPKTIEILKSFGFFDIGKSWGVNYQFRWVSGEGAQIKKRTDTTWVFVRTFDQENDLYSSAKKIFDVVDPLDGSYQSYLKFLGAIKEYASDKQNGEGILIIEDNREISAAELGRIGVGALETSLALPAQPITTQISSTCRNNQIDAGDFCDIVDGKIKINGGVGKIEIGKSELRWTFVGVTTLKFDDPESCTLLATSDCDDDVYGKSLEEGFCSNDCTFYAPKIECRDPDPGFLKFEADKGSSYWYWAKLSLVNGASNIDKSYFKYLNSDIIYGDNPCVREGITPNFNTTFSLSAKYDERSSINILKEGKETGYLISGTIVQKKAPYARVGRISAAKDDLGETIQNKYIISLTAGNIDAVKKDLGYDINGATIKDRYIILVAK